MCKAWYHDQLKFVRWALTHGWKKSLQLDRRDNDVGYKPSNCRFVTSKTNSRNRNNTKMVEYRGKLRIFAELVEKYAVVSHGTASQRVFSMGWSIEAALKTPARVGNYR